MFRPFAESRVSHQLSRRVFIIQYICNNSMSVCNIIIILLCFDTSMNASIYVTQYWRSVFEYLIELYNYCYHPIGLQ
jgi:hypothetical protein